MILFLHGYAIDHQKKKKKNGYAIVCYVCKSYSSKEMWLTKEMRVTLM